MTKLVAIAAVAGFAAAANAQLYTADWSVAGGFTHDSSNAPAAGPQSFNGANYTLSYDNTPSTDGSENFFRSTGVLLESSDFGGDHSFETFSIDISAITSVDINVLGATVGSGVFNNTGVEFFEWFYTLAGGSEQVFLSTDADGSLDASVIGLDVTGASTLTVGFNANINGGGDGFEITSVVIDGIPTPGAVALSGLAGLAAIRRKR